MDTILRFERKDEGSIPSGGTKGSSGDEHPTPSVYHWASPGEGTKIMKKIFFAIILISLIILPFAASAAIVPCGNPGQNPCTLADFFVLLGNIYNFIVKTIAAPLATIAIVIGGVMMLISAGNPGRFQQGKQILIYAIIGLVLAFGSWLIVKTLLTAMGYRYSL